MIRSLPPRSVTSRPPSGRNARLHGWDSPFATTTTRMSCPSAVWYTTGLSGSGGMVMPCGAIGVLFLNGTVCCAIPLAPKTMTMDAAQTRRACFNMSAPSFPAGLKACTTSAEAGR